MVRPRSRPRWTAWIPAGLVLMHLLAVGAAAEVVRVVIDHREVLFEGRVFGRAGAYEKLVGRIFFAFDPSNPANARVVDLDLAPRDPQGRVEVWADFVVLQPVDAKLRRGVAWVDLATGGVGGSLALLNGATTTGVSPSTEAEVGDGLLLDEGLTLIWVGWQDDPAMGSEGLSLRAPAAREADGAPVTGWVRTDWVVDSATDRLPLAREGRRPYPVVVPEAPVHVLTVRTGRNAARDTLARDEWSFVLAEDGRDAGRPVAIAREGGFEAGHIYELVYRAQDPRVLGLGLAVVRDIMAYARYDLRSEFPTNRGVAFGVGAGGRFLRQFLFEGFNADEGGRKVFDGVWVHGAGAGRGSFNARFAQPDRGAHGLLDFDYPVDLFPFSDSVQFDPVTGLERGLLDGLSADTRPRTLFTHTGYDYWGRAAALTHTSVDGFRDLKPVGDARAYHLASTAPSTAPSAARVMTSGGAPSLDPPSQIFTLRALAVAMTAWIADDVAPPPSRLPEVGAGTLVPARGVAYPGVPGLAPPPPIHLAYRLDFGPRFATDGVIDREPPILGPAFPAQVPQVDGVGNELGGVRSLDLRVPLATYLSWNVRADGPFSGQPVVGQGRAVPLPLSDAEATAHDDPRPSLERLYGSEAGFLARVRAAAAALVAEGFLLERDREAAIVRARERWLRLTTVR